MNKESTIKRLVKEIAGTDKARPVFRIMEVESVEGDLCTARLGKMKVPGIRLCAIEDGSPDGILVEPAVGSKIVVADISLGEMRDLVAISYSAVERITLQGNAAEGIVIEAEKLALYGEGDKGVVITPGEVKVFGDGDTVPYSSKVEKRLEDIENDIETLRTAMGEGWQLALPPAPPDNGTLLKTALTTSGWLGSELPKSNEKIGNENFKHE